jgi:dihydroxy-acid dehydratase
MSVELRSRAWFGRTDMEGFANRSWTRAGLGFSDAQFDGRPVIGIANSASDLTTCNTHLRFVAEAVKRGVFSAGGLPMEFPTLSLGEILMKPTTMLYRNLMAMEVEECLRGYPLDAVVLLSGCDKTTPAMLMGAASADIPAIMVTVGPMLRGVWRGRELGSGTDVFRLGAERYLGQLSDEDLSDAEHAMNRSPGHCMVMGTASTMACVAEALGMTLRGNAAIPAVDSRRMALAEDSGRRAVALALQGGPRPSKILTAEAFDNAIRAGMAIGGSTNAIIHLIALAGRVGVDLPLQRFDELSLETPLLVDVQPSGQCLMEAFYYAGGLPAVLNQLTPLLHCDALTVSGETLRESVAGAETHGSEVIRSLDDPLSPEGGTVILTGNLCPRGAVLTRAAASPDLLRHRGPAVVFENASEMWQRVMDETAEFDPASVLVLRGGGPKGAPGMPEWGVPLVPLNLLKRGVRDMVRISDARMSGTSFGTTVLHVAPESAVGGPLALVKDGDLIELNTAARTLDMLVPEPELNRRQSELHLPEPHFTRGYGAMFLDHILQADQGCDFDFLRGATRPGARTEVQGT